MRLLKICCACDELACGAEFAPLRVGTTLLGTLTESLNLLNRVRLRSCLLLPEWRHAETRQLSATPRQQHRDVRLGALSKGPNQTHLLGRRAGASPKQRQTGPEGVVGPTFGSICPARSFSRQERGDKSRQAFTLDLVRSASARCMLSAALLHARGARGTRQGKYGEIISTAGSSEWSEHFLGGTPFTPRRLGVLDLVHLQTPGCAADTRGV